MADVLVLFAASDAASDGAAGVVAAARIVATASGGVVVAAVLGADAAAAERVAAWGADRVLFIGHESLASYSLGAYRRAALAAIDACGAETVLMAATSTAWDLGPRLAAHRDAAFVSDVSALQVDAGRIVCTRSAFGGKLEARLACMAPRTVLTVDADAFSAPATQTKHSHPTAPIERLALDAVEEIGARTVSRRRADHVEVDLARCEIVVAGGRGLGDAERFAEVMFPLADALEAGLGASRPVVDAGWVARAHQVGSSGQVVKPRVYMACAISGAAQHLAGMRAAGFVIAINKDRHAPIFSVCDLGVLGDVHEVVPALTAAVHAYKGSDRA